MTVSGNEPAFVHLIHFVLPGWSNAFCNEAFPGDTKWSGKFDAENDWADPRFTMHVDKVTCPDCVTAIRASHTGIEESPKDPEPEEVELDHYDRAVAWVSSIGKLLTDDQAIAAAGVYATLAVADALKRVETGMEGLRDIWRDSQEARGDDEERD